MIKTLAYLGFVYLIIVLVTGCANSKMSTDNNKNSRTNLQIPKSPKFTLPGGSYNNWRYIGTTLDNQIADEIDDNSIKSVDIQTYQYQDRKTIISPRTFIYVQGQTPYKFALSEWIMDCAKHAYLLQHVNIYDTYGAFIKNYDYSKDNSVKWLNFGENTIASMQYNYICLNQNKMLGY